MAEMLLKRNAEFFGLVADAFKMRLANHESEAYGDAWWGHLMAFIQKTAVARQVRAFRPIAVLPVLRKLCSRAIKLIRDGELLDLKSSLFAFRAKHQAVEVMFALCNLTEKCIDGRSAFLW
jgi:hypothetical protein